jgi:hypothetical protein
MSLMVKGYGYKVYCETIITDKEDELIHSLPSQHSAQSSNLQDGSGRELHTSSLKRDKLDGNIVMPKKPLLRCPEEYDYRFRSTDGKALVWPSTRVG